MVTDRPVMMTDDGCLYRRPDGSTYIKAYGERDLPAGPTRMKNHRWSRRTLYDDLMDFLDSPKSTHDLAKMASRPYATIFTTMTRLEESGEVRRNQHGKHAKQLIWSKP